MAITISKEIGDNVGGCDFCNNFAVIYTIEFDAVPMRVSLKLCPQCIEALTDGIGKIRPLPIGEEVVCA